MKIQDLKVGDVLVGKVSKEEYTIVAVYFGFIELNHGIKLNIDQLQGYELKNEYLSFEDLVDGEVYYFEEDLKNRESILQYFKNKNCVNYTLLTDNLISYEPSKINFDNGQKFKKATPEQILLFESKLTKKVKGFEVGEYDNLLCYVWDDEHKDGAIRFIKRVVDEHEPFIDSVKTTWMNCRPLTQDERKFLEVDSEPIKK